MVRQLLSAQVELIPASCFKSTTEKPGVSQSILLRDSQLKCCVGMSEKGYHDLPVSREPKMDQVVILGNDLTSWAGEVQRVRLFRPAKIVELKNKMLRKIRLVALAHMHQKWPDVTRQEVSPRLSTQRLHRQGRTCDQTC